MSLKKLRISLSQKEFWTVLVQLTGSDLSQPDHDHSQDCNCRVWIEENFGSKQ